MGVQIPMRRGSFEEKGAVHCKVQGLSAVKTAEQIEMPFGMWTRMGSRKHVLDDGAHWRNLANTIESSMSGGDAPFLSNYLDHLFFVFFCFGALR